MRIRHVFSIATVLVITGMSSTAWAQTSHIATPAAMQQAVDSKRQAEAADRALVLDVLKTPEAATVAHQMGMDLTRAQQAVATLGGADLAQLAETARTSDADHAAGASTIVVSTTTVILVLIIIILLLL